jgi:hypothetical protein
MARDGVLLLVIQRQLGRVDLGVTLVDLQGIDNSEVVARFIRGAARGRPG